MDPLITMLGLKPSENPQNLVIRHDLPEMSRIVEVIDDKDLRQHLSKSSHKRQLSLQREVSSNC